MKIEIDDSMIKALLELGSIEHDTRFSAETRAISGFINSVVLPLAGKGRKAKEESKYSLLSRARSVKALKQG